MTRGIRRAAVVAAAGIAIAGVAWSGYRGGSGSRDDRRIKELEERLADLRDEVAVLRRAQLRQSFARLPPALQRGAVGNPDDRNHDGNHEAAPRPAIDQPAMVADFEARLSREPSSADKAPEAGIERALKAFPGIMLETVTCRPSFCRVVVDFQGSDARATFLDGMEQQEAFQHGVMSVADPDPERGRHTFYVARPGHPLMPTAPL